MAHGVYRVFPASISSGNSYSSEVDLGQSYQSVYLEVESMVSNSELHIFAANESGGTYRRVYHPVVNSSVAEINAFAIESACTNGMIPIPSGFRYYKIYETAAAANGQSFHLVCADLGN